jgi:hypothetical protein
MVRRNGGRGKEKVLLGLRDYGTTGLLTTYDGTTDYKTTDHQIADHGTRREK